MIPVVYDGKLEQCHNLPYYITLHNYTFVYESDIIELICEGNIETYKEFFFNRPNFHLYLDYYEDKIIFPLIAFVNECVSIYDRHVSENIENRFALEEQKADVDMLSHMSERIYPVVLALAKIGAKIQFGEIKPGETPSMIFERELIRISKEEEI